MEEDLEDTSWGENCLQNKKNKNKKTFEELLLPSVILECEA